jgi:hypothetical protein
MNIFKKSSSSKASGSDYSIICPGCKKSIFDSLEDGLRLMILTIANTPGGPSTTIEFPCPKCGTQLFADPVARKIYKV